ncbi:hypothetical protein, partial [Akkermansia sp.]|uniref:hypothetical protein n=1 Tax=Akkermansia sp. TaxID=1872421 RepID=UPI0025BA80D1
MIIDDNNVFFDGATKTPTTSGGQTAAGESGWVPLTGFMNPGQVGPIPIHICLSGGLKEADSLNFTLEQADNEGDAGEEVGTMTVKGPLRSGGTVAWRFIPHGVTKPWLKLKFTEGATLTSSGSVTAMIVREDLTGSYQDNTDL